MVNAFQVDGWTRAFRRIKGRTPARAMPKEADYPKPVEPVGDIPSIDYR
jgi:hypothetical protein